MTGHLSPRSVVRSLTAAVSIACVAAATVSACATLSACQKPQPQKIAPKTSTIAELRVVRNGVHVAEEGAKQRDPYPRERLSDGELVRLDEGALAWLRRDGDATILARGPALLTARADAVDIASGSLFVESPSGVVTKVTTPAGVLFLSDVRASIEVNKDASEIYVLAGEVRTENGDVARTGERMHLEKSATKVSPETSWEDWTGGLATTDRKAAPAPFGMGTVGARKPGATGEPRSPLTISKLDVRVKVEGDFATTEVDETFFNPISETVEGIYRFRAPDGANLERFGIDRQGGIAWGYVKEKAAAATQYESHVYAGSREDPALLQWQAPGEYEARLYPIAPGATRRVVVRYTEWLGHSGSRGERRLYVYPMAADGSEDSLPHVEEFSADIDLSKAGAASIRPGMEATRDGDHFRIRRHDFVPRSDLSVELFAADPAAFGSKEGHAAASSSDSLPIYRSHHQLDEAMLPPAERGASSSAKEADYVLVPVSLSDLPHGAGGLDLEIVVDTSAATDRASLALARSATKYLLSHLEKTDRVALLTGDDDLRQVSPGDSFRSATEETKGELLEALARVHGGGATDLGKIMTEAIAKLPTKGRSALVYIGDGNPTVGELSLKDVRSALQKAARPARIFAFGIGESANMGLLAGIVNGGFAEPVTDEHRAAMSALHLFEVAEQAADLDVRVDLGPDVERVYPRDASAIRDGETLLVVGRLTNDKMPDAISIAGSLGTKTLKLHSETLDDHGDLRRRWAEQRLLELMSDGAGLAALVDLGVRQGIMTPVTSIYVPTMDEMTAREREAIDHTVGVAGESDDQERAQDLADRGEERAKAKGEAKRDDGKDRARGEEGKMSKATAVAEAAATAEPTAAPPPDRGVVAPGSPAPAMAGDGFGDSNGRLSGKLEARMGAVSPPKVPDPIEGARGGVMDTPPAPPVAQNEAPPSSATHASHHESDKGGQATDTTTTPMSGLGLTGVGEGGGGRSEGIGHGEMGPQGAATRNGPQKPGALTVEKNVKDELQKKVSSSQNATVIRNANVIILSDDPGRRIRLCGDAANLPFGERLALWRERLQGVQGSPTGARAVYQNALASCEAPQARERTALLLMMLDFIPATSKRVELYHLMASDSGAGDVLYRGILARVNTPDQMRELSAALGLVTIEPSLLEKALSDAKTPAERVTTLRAFAAQFPNDLNLALTLLDALEDADDRAGAREFADSLRTRADSDSKVRTAVGELYLRLASRDSDANEKAEDAEEARRAFGEIVEFSPDDPAARRRLGDLFRAHGLYADATRQYETLAKLTPDDPTVSLLLAASAEGLGKIEEAVKWTEKGGAAGSPDASQGPFATAQAFAATFIAWGKLDAKKAGDKAAAGALSARLSRVLALGHSTTKGRVRVVLTWSHPEFHPTLWSNAFGSPLPAPEGDVTLGVAQVMVPDQANKSVEVRLEKTDVERAARLGVSATLTAIFDENGPAEVITKTEVSFDRKGPNVLKFGVSKGELVKETSK